MILQPQSDLETRTKDLQAEEAEIADQRERHEAQRSIEFYDELGSELVNYLLFYFYFVIINLFFISFLAVRKGGSRNHAKIPLSWGFMHQN